MKVSSSRMSIRPRVMRYRARSPRATFRPCRNAAVPAKNTNPGAQKCVIQRVKNTPGVGPPAGTPEYTRTWSIALRTITRPRTMSIDVRRFVSGVRGAAGGAYVVPAAVDVAVIALLFGWMHGED